MHWYFDEVLVIERMREIQRRAAQAQALGLIGSGRIGLWGVRLALGRGLVALGERLREGKPVRRPELASSSQCALR